MGGFGGSVKLTGESAYKKALREITNNLAVLSSEMKVVSSTYDKNDMSTTKLASRNEVLSKTLEQQTKKLDEAKKMLEEAKTSTDNNSETIAKWQTEVNKAQAEVNKITNEIKKNNDVIESNEEKMKQNSTTYGALSSKIEEQQGKLQNLKQKYSNVVLEQGKNSTEAKNLARNIKDLSSDLNENKTKLDNVDKSADKFDESLEDLKNSAKETGDGFTIFKGILANLGSQAIAGALNGVKKLGSAIVDVAKQAIGSYADYEQLIGGVETLFKDSSNIVENYANNAYKTAGLSANEYIETVTSFSASLLQSLNGNTTEAAQVADMAIIDMADNANKMGTSMESIQNAYQGFAKQNYTMLDNLKLGYGGTKSEMERLLADAQKITGTKYDISNLNDVYTAIHVIQGELEITGTTAKEASTTISGSISSMKSAWSNLITGVADENANFEVLIGNFVDSVLTMSENIMPRIGTTLDGIVDLVLGLADTLLPKVLEIGVGLIQKLITGITSNIENLMVGINQVIDTIITALIDMLPEILNAGIKVIVSLIQGIATSLPTLIPQIIECVTLIVETLLDNIDLIIDAGIQLLIGLAEGLIESLPNLIDKIPVIIDKLVQSITNNLPKIISAGIEIIIKLAVGIVKAIPNLLAAIPKIITSLVTGISNYYSQMINKGKELLVKIKEGILQGISKIPEIGKNLVQGLWNGINDAKNWILDKIKGFGQSILNGIKSFFGIHSPSTLFRDEIGENLALGLGEGFTKEMQNVTNDMQNSIPTEFDSDVYTNINPIKNNISGVKQSAIDVMNVSVLKEAFVSAFKEFKPVVILDEKEIGEFAFAYGNTKYGSYFD